MFKHLIKNIFLTLMLLQAACGNHHDVKIKLPGGENGASDNSGMGGAEDEPPLTMLGFEDIYVGIIEQNCKTCHKGYVDYVNVKADADKILEQVLTNQMPKFSSGLSQELKDVLEEWVLAGAPEFGTRFTP